MVTFNQIPNILRVPFVAVEVSTLLDRIRREAAGHQRGMTDVVGASHERCDGVRIVREAGGRSGESDALDGLRAAPTGQVRRARHLRLG